MKGSLRRVLSGDNPGAVADGDHGLWYRELFAPSVTAGLLKAANLAGYRNGRSTYAARATSRSTPRRFATPSREQS